MTDTNTAEREALMDLIDAYAEARHVGGCHTYNAKTAEARAKVVASLAASAGSEPMFWVRLFRDGLYEGPVHHKSVVGKMLRDEKPGEWTPLYTHPSPQEGMAGWKPIATAPEGQMVVVGWLDPEDPETPARHDFDLLEDGCWQKWHDHAEHVEIIGGHGVSYTAPYTCWMPVPPLPASKAKEL